MAAGENISRQVDAVVATWDMVVSRRKMFGGTGYLLNGNLAFSVGPKGLLIRADEADAAALLGQKGITRMAMGGRTMPKNWFRVTDEAMADGAQLTALLEHARDFALSLPPKI